MAVLRNRATGELVVLRPDHVFGRNAQRADTHLDDPGVSLRHAMLQWRAPQWRVTDLSSNGSTLDGRPLTKGQAVVLAPGQTLCFSSAGAPVWQVLDVAAPCSALVPVGTDLPLIALERNHLLPNAQAPELSIYQAEAGHWVLESQGELRELADGDTVHIGAHAYRLRVVDHLDDTRVSVGIPDLAWPHLSFRLSLDEEHVRLQLTHGAHRADLGERSHHYALVTLARRRLLDALAGQDVAAQGWIAAPELAKMLGMEVAHLNIQIYRLRNQLMEALPQVAQLAHIVERRRGGLRLGDFSFEISRGSQFEGRYPVDSQDFGSGV
jgi:hypothetical protein